MTREEAARWGNGWGLNERKRNLNLADGFENRLAHHSGAKTQFCSLETNAASDFSHFFLQFDCGKEVRVMRANRRGSEEIGWQQPAAASGRWFRPPSPRVYDFSGRFQE